LTTCAKCGGELSRPATGRPPRYCSVGCRRATEFELRRLQGRLDAADEEVRAWAHEASVAPARGSPPFVRSRATCERSLAYREGQRDKLEVRMRDLLDDPEAAS